MDSNGHINEQKDQHYGIEIVIQTTFRDETIFSFHLLDPSTTHNNYTKQEGIYNSFSKQG